MLPPTADRGTCRGDRGRRAATAPRRIREDAPPWAPPPPCPARCSPTTWPPTAPCSSGSTPCATLDGAVRAAHGAADRLARVGGKLIFCGNGGSAADCQHIAAEFTGRFSRDRAAAGGARAHHRHLGADLHRQRLRVRRGLRAPGAGARPAGRLPGRHLDLGQLGQRAARFEAARRGGIATIGLLGRDGGRLLPARRPGGGGAGRGHRPHPGGAHLHRPHLVRAGRACARAGMSGAPACGACRSPRRADRQAPRGPAAGPRPARQGRRHAPPAAACRRA